MKLTRIGYCAVFLLLSFYSTAQFVPCPSSNDVLDLIEICSDQWPVLPELNILDVNDNPVEWFAGDPAYGPPLSGVSFANESCEPQELVLNAFMLCDDDDDPSTPEIYVDLNVSQEILIYPAAFSLVELVGDCVEPARLEVRAADGTLCEEMVGEEPIELLCGSSEPPPVAVAAEYFVGSPCAQSVESLISSDCPANVCAALSIDQLFFSENHIMLQGQMPEGIPLGGNVFRESFEQPLDLRFHAVVDFESLDGELQQGVYDSYLDFSFVGTDTIYSVVLEELFDQSPYGIGDYKIHYSLSSEIDGETAEGPVYVQEFKIRDNLLSKVPLGANGLPVSTTSYGMNGTDVPQNFRYGIHFYLPEEVNYQLDSLNFAYSGDGPGTLEGREVRIAIYEWLDDNNRVIEDEELVLKAFYSHVYTDEGNGERIWAKLINAATGSAGVNLGGGKHYIALGEYLGTEAMYCNVNVDIEYNAYRLHTVDLAEASDDSQLLRFGDVLQIGSTWYSAGFADASVPAFLLAFSEASEEPVEQVVNMGLFEDSQFFGSNYVSPEGQFGVLACGSYVTNYGGLKPDEAELSAKIYYGPAGSGEESLVFEDSESFDYSAGDTLFVYFDEDQLFDPTLMGAGDYRIEYELSSDPEDVSLFDNEVSVDFEIRENLLSKVPLSPEGLPQHDNSYGFTDGRYFEYGIHFYLPNGSELKADSVNFGWSAGAGAELSGQYVRLHLYHWIDDGDFAVDQFELELVGTYDHQYTDEANNEKMWGTLVDPNTEGPVNLRDESHYILAAVSEGGAAMFLNIFSDIDYDSYIDYCGQQAAVTGDGRNLRFADLVFDNGTWYTRGFALGVPSLLVAFSESVPGVAVEQLAEQSRFKLNLHKNPVYSTLAFDLQCPAAQPARVLIVDATGRVCRELELTAGSHSLAVRELPTGLYILQAKVGGQSKSFRFVKQ